MQAAGWLENFVEEATSQLISGADNDEIEFITELFIGIIIKTRPAIDYTQRMLLGYFQLIREFCGKTSVLGSNSIL